MTKQEALIKKYVEKLRETKQGDKEAAHESADRLLTELLKELGYREVVQVYENIPKWYS